MSTIGKAGIAIPERYVDLSAHVAKDGVCIHCGETVSTETYDEYVAWWTANEYEGDPHHEPMTEEVHAYIRITCLAHPDDLDDQLDSVEYEGEAAFIRQYPGVL